MWWPLLLSSVMIGTVSYVPWGSTTGSYTSWRTFHGLNTRKNIMFSIRTSVKAGTRTSRTLHPRRRKIFRTRGESLFRVWCRARLVRGTLPYARGQARYGERISLGPSRGRYHEQIAATDLRSPWGPITRRKLACEVAKRTG